MSSGSEIKNIFERMNKEAVIELANEYKNIIPKYVYDIVVGYEFDIRNDRNYVA